MKKSFQKIVLIFLLILYFSSSALAAELTPTEVRLKSVGMVATVRGYAFSGTDSDGTGFENEFYLSDTSNAKGICVTIPNSEKITLYKEYSVTGTLSKENGELKLNATHITPLSGSATRIFKRFKMTEALDYGQSGGTFARLSGEASDPVISGKHLSSFTLTKDGSQIRVVIESGVMSLSKGENGKAELTEKLRYKRNVTVDGFIAKIGSETVIRIKDCDDIDVQYHVCKFGEAVTEKEPSCGITGLSVRVCDCGMKEETTIPALSHNFYEETERNSTCTVFGLKVKKCRNCSFREETRLPLKDHSYAEKTETPATCSSEGVFLRYCKNCTLREETPIPKTEHSYRERTEVEPTCTREGVRVRYCYYCSFREETAIPKNAHSFAEKTETPATCDKEGVYLRYCKNCSLREEKPIPKTDHNFKEKTEKEATCTEEGIKVKYCSACSFREESKLPKTEHKLKEKTEKEATCTEEGIKV
ncbi:MAG: hypothetical protein IKJ70_03930, partial [Clostridia bacterium]|nr:hypothetical protein [Clostridia bacterium]